MYLEMCVSLCVCTSVCVYMSTRDKKSSYEFEQEQKGIHLKGKKD